MRHFLESFSVVEFVSASDDACSNLAKNYEALSWIFRDAELVSASDDACSNLAKNYAAFS